MAIHLDQFLQVGLQHNSVTAVYIRRDYSLLINIGLLVQHNFRIFNINTAVLSQGMWWALFNTKHRINSVDSET